MLYSTNPRHFSVTKQVYSNGTGDRDFYTDKFRYDAEKKVYICPSGKELYFARNRTSKDKGLFGTCAEVCPTAAIAMQQQDGHWSISLDASRCTQCGLCKDVCCRKSIEIISTVALDVMLAQIPRVLIVKRQEEIDNLLQPLEQRMACLLGCVVTN
nr:hypothetical protein [Sporomusa silvacetica]